MPRPRRRPRGLRELDQENYLCHLCAARYEPSLDELVEVAFTVSPNVRRIHAHEPDQLSPNDFVRFFYFSSAVPLPSREAWDDILRDMVMESEEVRAGRASSSPPPSPPSRASCSSR